MPKLLFLSVAVAAAEYRLHRLLSSLWVRMAVKVVPLDNQTHILERLIDSAPQVVDKIQSMIKSMSAKPPAAVSTSVTNVGKNQNFIV